MLVLTADSWLSAETAPAAVSNLQEKAGGDLPQGYFIQPKGKREADDYLVSVGSRKGSGAVNVDLPYRGTAAGMNFEVTALESKEFVSICDCRIKVDRVQLLEYPSRPAYSKAVQVLLEKRSAGGGFPPALDPYKGTTVLPLLGASASDFCTRSSAGNFFQISS